MSRTIRLALAAGARGRVAKGERVTVLTCVPLNSRPVASSIKYVDLRSSSGRPPNGWWPSQKNCGIVTSSGTCARGPPPPYIVGMSSLELVMVVRGEVRRAFAVCGRGGAPWTG